MPVAIAKIQILTADSSRHPIFYSHFRDEGHEPALDVRVDSGSVVIACDNSLYKVKANPQTKNRIDIYMTLESARQLGRLLSQASPGAVVGRVHESQADPNARRAGRMQLPIIHKAWYVRPTLARASTRAGTRLQQANGYLNVDLESPHPDHIVMDDLEVHLGIPLDAPIGTHDSSLTQPHTVPVTELQRGTNERNPVHKVYADVSVTLVPGVAAGLGALLQTIAPEMANL